MKSAIIQTMYVVKDMHKAIKKLDKKFPFSSRQEIANLVTRTMLDPATHTKERRKIDVLWLVGFLEYLSEHDGYDWLVAFFFDYNDGKDYGFIYDHIAYVQFMMTDIFEKKDCFIDGQLESSNQFFKQLYNIFRMKQEHENRQAKGLTTVA